MRLMKDSGIPWIGEIPVEWQVHPARYAFSEIRTKNTDGSVTNALKFYNGTIVPKANFDAESDDYVAETITNYTIVQPDTIMINGLNLNYDLKSLRVGLVKETGVITSAYLALWPDSNRILPRFATYLFKGYETKMAFHNMGAGIRKTLGFKEFKQQPILIPSLQEQQRVVDCLDEKCAQVDAVMEQTRVSIEEYKKLKQSIITEAVTKGIRPNRPMKDSGIDWIGQIPSEWAVERIKNIVMQIESGVSVNAAIYPARENEIGVLKTSCVSKFCFLPNENKAVNEEELHRVACDVKENTIIMSRMNTPDLVGACGYVDKNYPNLFLPDRLWQIQFAKTTNVKYVWYYLNSKKVRSYYGSLAVGTSSSMQNISQDQFYHTYITSPRKEEQDAIVSYLDKKTDAIDSIIEQKEQFLSEMESYKKSLIFEYVTGKKEVS